MKKLLIILILIIHSGCTYYIRPRINDQVLSNDLNKIHTKILINIPDDFKQNYYVASYDAKELRFFWGEAIKEKFPQYLDNVFDSVLIYDPNQRINDFDYFATPSFINLNSYVTFGVFDIETGIKIDFVSKDKTKTFSVLGKGEGKAHLYFENLLTNAGEDALEQTLKNLKKDIYNKENFFNK